MNIAEETIDDIVIFHVDHGQDLFVSLTGDWKPSCFGESFSRIILLPNPIRGYTTKELKDIGSNDKDLDDKPTIPKELWKIIDFLKEIPPELV